MTTIAQENVWIKSTCFMCWNTCGFRVNRVNGTIVKIEGDPDYPKNHGTTCAKGNSGPMLLCEPNRVLFPMRRTNPVKGFDVDLKRERISWEDALRMLEEKLRKIRAEDSRKLALASFDTRAPSGVFMVE